jgi:hypothetical protein
MVRTTSLLSNPKRYFLLIAKIPLIQAEVVRPDSS